MPETNGPLYTFTVQGLPADTFHVVRFTGSTGFSRSYSFDIVLFSSQESLDFAQVMAGPASLTIKRKQGDIPFRGRVSSFEHLHHTGKHVLYRATLSPRLWWLRKTQHSRIFMDKSVDEFLTDVLADAGLSKGLNFEFTLKKQYQPWRYICQYNETDYDFFSRWCEREGFYYYYDHSPETAKVRIVDDLSAHQNAPMGSTLPYRQVSGMGTETGEEVLTSLFLTQTLLPRQVKLRDYYYERPDLAVEAVAQVDENGHGEMYSFYEDHVRTQEEAQSLAAIRAQEYACRGRVFQGAGTGSWMRPGFTFTVKDHPMQAYNGTFLATRVDHEGAQEGWLTSGLGITLSQNADRLYYRNTFEAIPADVQFRAERVTKRPRCHGVIPAKIDAEGSGQYAMLDDLGRYKVVMPFDLSGRKGGKASCWLRMAQPLAGSCQGMHFPLHKGAEVLVGFLDGDPDRPYITASVPNPETASPVTSSNQTQSVVHTSGGNMLIMEDMSGRQGILLKTPTNDTHMSIGPMVGTASLPAVSRCESPEARFLAASDPAAPAGATAQKGGAGTGSAAQSNANSSSGASGPSAGSNPVGSGYFSSDLDTPKNTGHDWMDKGGLNLFSSGPLSIQADTANTVIIGESTTNVGGLYMCDVGGAAFLDVAGANTTIVGGFNSTAVLGANTTAVLGANTNIVVGNCMDVSLSIKEVVNISRTVLEVNTTKLKGIVTKLRGQKTEINGDETLVDGDKTKVVANESKLSANEDTVTGSRGVVAGNYTKLAAAKEDIAAAETKAMAETTEVCAEKSEVAGDSNSIVAEMDSILAEFNEIVGEKIVI